MRNFNKLQWYESLMVNLVSKNRWVGEIWTLYERAIFKHKLYPEEPCESIDQENMIKWYKKNPKGYPKIWYPKRKFHIKKKEDRDIVKTIEKEHYSNLNYVLETMLVHIFKQGIQEKRKDSDVFKTTNFDDIISWIDAIVQIGEWKNSRYVWVDFCVSSNVAYIEEKKNKRLITEPKEFQHYSWYNESIPRMVKDFNPEVISHVFEYYLNQIVSWEDPNENIGAYYQEVRTQISQNKWQEAIQTQNTMKDAIEEILT